MHRPPNNRAHAQPNTQCPTPEIASVASLPPRWEGACNTHAHTHTQFALGCLCYRVDRFAGLSHLVKPELHWHSTQLHTNQQTVFMVRLTSLEAKATGNKRLIEGDPVFHKTAQVAEHSVSIVHKILCQPAGIEAAICILQLLGQIPVEEGDHRLHPGSPVRRSAHTIAHHSTRTFSRVCLHVVATCTKRGNTNCVRRLTPT